MRVACPLGYVQEVIERPAMTEVNRPAARMDIQLVLRVRKIKMFIS